MKYENKTKALGLINEIEFLKEDIKYIELDIKEKPYENDLYSFQLSCHSVDINGDDYNYIINHILEIKKDKLDGLIYELEKL